jgi:preprotein translocase subunit SecA
MIDAGIERLVDELIGDDSDPGTWDRARMETELLLKFLLSVPGLTDAAQVKDRNDLIHAARQAGREAFRAKLEYFGEIETRVGAAKLGEQALSHIMLTVIDEKWKDHLYDLDQLRAAIQYRAWGQKDPLIEYKQEAYDMFVGLMHDLRSTFAERWLKLQIEVGPAQGAPGGPSAPAGRPGGTPLGTPRARRPTPMVASKAEADGLISAEPAPGKGQTVQATTLAPSPYSGVGRNDPCPCGSGKKFKKCHGAAL